jgi:anti-anti-sigma factor
MNPDAPDSGLSFRARAAGGIAIAELRGELDMTCAPLLRDQLLSLLRRGSSKLVIDLAGVTYCDASGLAVLVGTARRAQLIGGSVRLAAVSAQVDEVLHLTDLYRHFEVCATVRIAIDSARGASHPADRDPGQESGRPARRPPSESGLGRRWAQADLGELRKATTAVLIQSDAWRDADSSRRFSSVLRSMAHACHGNDDTALEVAARSLMTAMARHPLAHSHAVAASATRLRRVLDTGYLAAGT